MEEQYKSIVDKFGALTASGLKKLSIYFLKKGLLKLGILSTGWGAALIYIIEWGFDKFVIPMGEDLKLVLENEADEIIIHFKVKKYVQAKTSAEFDSAFDDLIK